MKNFGISIIFLLIFLRICSTAGPVIDVGTPQTASPQNMQDAYNANTILFEDGSEFYIKQNGIRFQDVNGKSRLFKRGHYFNLQYRAPYLYALDTRDELHDPVYLVRFNLETGKEERILTEIQQVYVFEDRSLFYYDFDEKAYCLAKEDASDKEKILASDSMLTMQAFQESILLYEKGRILIYSRDSGFRTLYEGNDTVCLTCCLRDATLFVIYQKDYKGDSYATELDPYAQTITTFDTNICLRNSTTNEKISSVYYDFFAMTDTELQVLCRVIDQELISEVKLNDAHYLVSVINPNGKISIKLFSKAIKINGEIYWLDDD